MSLRMMEIIVPGDREEQARSLLEGLEILGCWRDGMTNLRCAFKVLLPVEETEPVMDRLENAFSQVEGFNVVLLNVEAELPRRNVEKTPEDDARPGHAAVLSKTPLRISREELFLKVSANMKCNGVFIAMVFLSTIVAAVGLITDSVAVIIGAMVVAPLLGPNVGLALATTLGDWQMIRGSLKANLVGMALAFVVAVSFGCFVDFDPSNEEMLRRTSVGASDFFLAMAAGCAGVLCFTSGLSAPLIGVMVAVALLPPLVVVGLMTGAGEYAAARGAALQLLTNVICVNLAGILTFYFQGVRPRTWWQADEAKRATRVSFFIWTSLLIVLVVIALYAGR